jgi:hypothetical protein
VLDELLELVDLTLLLEEVEGEVADLPFCVPLSGLVWGPAAPPELGGSWRRGPC